MSHMAPLDRQHVLEGPIVIEDYALLGMSTRVMPRVRVGRGAIVHGNVELTRNVPAFANFGGLPRGKRIGWRAPRRQSPHWQTRESEIVNDEQSGAMVREVLDHADHDTLDRVADMHVESLSTAAIGDRQSVRDYYLAIVLSNVCTLWVAEANGRVVGFICGTTDRRQFEQDKVARRIQPSLLGRLLTFRLSPGEYLRESRRRNFSNSLDDAAELLTLVIESTGRELGLGQRFSDSWTSKLQTCGQSSYVVFTDNTAGVRFEPDNGGETLMKFNAIGLGQFCYRFNLGDDGPEFTEQRS